MIAKFGLTKIHVTDNGTEIINKKIITLCHLYNIKHKPGKYHAPLTNGLVEGTNRSSQEYLRCVINGNDSKYTESSSDVKLFLYSYYSKLAYNSKITSILGISPYEMFFNQNSRKPTMFTATYSENAQGNCQPTKGSFFFTICRSHTWGRSFLSSINLENFKPR